MIKRRIFKDISTCILSVLITVFLFPGCTFVSFGHQKEAKEEKEIFGFLDGYNHRIKEAQGYLMNAGFNPGPIDGKMQRDTRKAIKNFQRDNGLKITGFIGTETWKKLGSYKNIIKTRAKVNKKSDSLGYYSSTLEGTKELQQALKNSGFDPGPIDGKIGSKTKKAIMDFQSAKGLSGNGTIDSKTLEALSKYFTTK
ncbi:MAG: peptidoglycan-binding protein [Candidatus Omnitrophica bacterium]|nr:peptidoglycan-binding protein [Candidatus Omnitrophota bacterium]